MELAEAHSRLAVCRVGDCGAGKIVLSLRLALRRSASVWVVCCTAIGAAPAAAQDDGIWPVPGQNLAGFRYSPLDQIDTENVKKLGDVGELCWLRQVR